ncbi:unnamed protein product [Ixodes pacificus]
MQGYKFPEYTRPASTGDHRQSQLLCGHATCFLCLEKIHQLAEGGRGQAVVGLLPAVLLGNAIWTTCIVKAGHPLVPI